ncbi:MAG: ATP synthase F1 subunit gamma, partial [Phycisphaerales bacterium]|nr:ATP synthase F1 subunit gamma [Phycisphaerales bacterium]
RAQKAATATKPFTEGVFELVRQIADNLGGGSGGAGEISHPLISGPAGVDTAAAKKVTLIITSDRGLCGPYNGSILRTAMARFRNDPAAKPGAGGEVGIAGRKGASFLKFNNVPTTRQHAIGDKPEYAAIERLAQGYIERFIAGEISSVHVVYMRFISAGRQKPEVMQLLPLQPPPAAAVAGESKQPVQYEFSPAGPELLDSLLPMAIKSMLMQAVNDAIVSEHIARMVAMKSATDNAGKMGKRLTRSYNRARQAQITTELTEIISGAAALE